MDHCPGKYCGRMKLENGSFGDCGACLHGFRTNGSICLPCMDSPEFYDWSYLFFMALVALILHWFCIDFTVSSRSFTKEAIVLHISAFVEISLAAICTLLLMEPVGSLQIRSCRNQELSDWYTLFHNPYPNYEDVLYCTQEAVYPLYTMVFIFYVLATLMMLLIRPWLASHFNKGKMTVYAGLYFYPILSLLQATLGGIIYYSYPYIVIVLSLISSARHFACKVDQSARGLIMSSVTNLRNAVIVLGHWLLHAFGIVAITEMRDPKFDGALLALVPLPAVFYIATTEFTDPRKQHVD